MTRTFSKDREKYGRARVRLGAGGQVSNSRPWKRVGTPVKSEGGRKGGVGPLAVSRFVPRTKLPVEERLWLVEYSPIRDKGKNGPKNLMSFSFVSGVPNKSLSKQ